MRKQLLIIGLVVAVVLCIAAAGCTSTTQVQDQQTQVQPTVVTKPTYDLTGEPIVGEWTTKTTGGWAGDDMKPGVKHTIIIKVTDDGWVTFTEKGKSKPVAEGVVTGTESDTYYTQYNIKSYTDGMDDLWVKYYTNWTGVMGHIHDNIHKITCGMTGNQDYW